MTEAAESVTIVYDCTWRELNEGTRILIRLKRRKKPAGPIVRHIPGIVLLISLGILLWIACLSIGPATTAPKSRTLPVVMDAVFAIGFGFFIAGEVGAKRTMLARFNSRPARVTYCFDGSGVTVRRPGRIMFYAWIRFINHAEGSKVLVLCIYGKTGIIIPKRLFAAESDRERMRMLMRERIVHAAIPIHNDIRPESA